MLIEAMAAAGGIVLAGNNPGYASVLGSLPGSMIDVTSTKHMARHISTMITNTERRNALFEEQQKHVVQFDTPIVAQKLLKLYQRPLQSNA